MKLNVSTYHGYVVATGLRGPDDRRYSTLAEHWKSLVTGPLRHFAGVSRIGACRQRPAWGQALWAELCREEQRSIIRWASRTGYHTKSHAKQAFESISTLLSNRRRKQCDTYRKWLTEQKLL